MKTARGLTAGRSSYPAQDRPERPYSRPETPLKREGAPDYWFRGHLGEGAGHRCHRIYA